MKIAHINENNQLLGWYDKEIHGTFIEPIYETKTTIINKVETVEKVLVKDGYWDTSKIPTPNIEVNEDVWQNAIDNGHNKVNSDGTTEYFDFRTSEEIEAQNLQSKINEAKKYLSDTDYKMTFDYFATLTKELQDELIRLRSEARELIRATNEF